MNTDSNLLRMQSFIGREMTSSPSPFMLWLKPVVVSAEKGKLCLKYIVRKEMTNPFGTLHGGVTSAIIDDIIGATMFSLDESYHHISINYVIDFFNPARKDDIILAETSINKYGGKVANAECIVWDEKKTRIIAKGYSNMYKISLEKNDKIFTVI